MAADGRRKIKGVQCFQPIPIPAFLLKGKVDADLILPLRGRTEVGVGAITQKVNELALIRH
jgi:hypothetical protein